MFGLLTFTHRWFGVALAIFMLGWFSSGLVIALVGGPPSTRSEQLLHASSLAPQEGWLSLGQALKLSAAAHVSAEGRAAAPKVSAAPMHEHGAGRSRGDGAVVDARLTRIDGAPAWIVEAEGGRRRAISALDGAVLDVSAAQAERIVRSWLAAPASLQLSYSDTVDAVVGLRNADALKPFHRIAIEDGAGSQAVVSERTGEVVQLTTRAGRAVAYAGAWLHLFRWLDALGVGEYRRDVLTYAGFFAAFGALTGMILGFIRWRPGYFGRPTYSGGRTQPFREFWFKYHFWAGLIGGTFALLWAASGFLSTNPGQIFSSAAASPDELSRYRGGPESTIVADWKPDAQFTLDPDVVELQWSRVGEEATLFAVSRDGARRALPISGTAGTFSEAALFAAAQRLAGETRLAGHELLQVYDSYYYPGHRQAAADKPLPVLRVDLADAGNTSLYIDPVDGRLLAKFDDSRRAYRWLYSAVHHWDFGWFRQIWLWNAWMIVWVSFGLALAASAVVLGWRRLRRTAREALT
ncbi:PepSY domain-containing protein [Methylocystis heyeri]|uniref:PepSY domain-containing protein n=1 Tax=Methylocystis heyeri TaxID=391905 RepID=A0A6B8KDW5_9HYPH|nr:PepSY domain-containing protein [Methylocystis heyeri]QGM46634.1 hypothetical protein H2LOC_013550 [Methylocystis heyeri]